MLPAAAWSALPVLLLVNVSQTDRVPKSVQALIWISTFHSRPLYQGRGQVMQDDFEPVDSRNALNLALSVLVVCALAFAAAFGLAYFRTQAWALILSDAKKAPLGGAFCNMASTAAMISCSPNT